LCINSKKKKSPNSTESLENSNLENVYSSNINRDLQSNSKREEDDLEYVKDPIKCNNSENLDQTTRDKDNINNSVQNYLKKNNEINNINNLNINGNVNNEEKIQRKRSLPIQLKALKIRI